MNAKNAIYNWYECHKYKVVKQLTSFFLHIAIDDLGILYDLFVNFKTDIS
jgi:hypothetical protein